LELAHIQEAIANYVSRFLM